MIKVLKLHTAANLPKAAHPGKDLAWDIYSANDVIIPKGEMGIINTGIAVQVEGPLNAGFLLRERSSQASKGIKLLGGVIDPGYQGEWKIMLVNLGTETYEIRVGDRIAQAILIPSLTGLPINWTEAFEKETERGDKGFGSSGK